MLIAEIFGYGVDNQTEEAWESRRAKRCPFRDGALYQIEQNRSYWHLFSFRRRRSGISLSCSLH